MDLSVTGQYRSGLVIYCCLMIYTATTVIYPHTRLKGLISPCHMFVTYLCKTSEVSNKVSRLS